MNTKGIFLFAAGCGAYATFMIGFLLTLTLFLPSIPVDKPDWIEVGSYAAYTVEEYVSPRLVENGTYVWRIISMHTDANGEVMVRINETYALEWKEDYWNSSWTNDIPSTGRISDVNVKDVAMDFWFNRYYNDYLVDLSDFKVGALVYEGIGLEEISIQAETRSGITLTTRRSSYYRTDGYLFDRKTGLLLMYGHGFRDRWGKMLLKNTNINNEAHDDKATIDLLTVSPLFVVPVSGAALGLLTIKQRKYRFSRPFWCCFVLFNGIILASVANWPIRAPLARLFVPFLEAPMIAYNVLFWIGALAAAVFLIDRFAIHMIQTKIDCP